MSKELKPCPFCGETSLIIEDNQMVQDVHVLCKDCGAKTSFDGIRYAVAGRWNVRPVERALKSRIEELEAENGRLRKAFPKWQSGEELPELMGEMILIETITGGYRTGSFAGIHSSGAIRYNTFDGLTRTIYPANIVRWAYIKALKGAGE